MKAQIWNYNNWITETDPAKLTDRYGAMLRGAGFNVIKTVEHHFTPQGFTALYLLGESHFAVHTFPEEGKTYIELSSCNKVYFDRFLRDEESNGWGWYPLTATT